MPIGRTEDLCEMDEDVRNPDCTVVTASSEIPAAGLETRGLPVEMSEAAYEDPDFSFEQNYEAMAAQGEAGD